ncbi:MAG TPA: FAD-dependent oxidoreductase [Smithella sp.]|jgi:2,4-dienoyl-CoA reductase-like NADH-dependent reductase (Old Yellow Enzyme family)|nr:FAD-dependent oxidoreductase [Smithella sp.]HOG09100.1 FAD-dependent oxidoreductase [Smithella sp.]HOS13730.1 FAD-dependent oxidoreductase [Smithella sp.]HOX97728.1 FAD-dependent oxidoreductase [Smithella sp.]HPC07291.1 FAD-dependent oxidoreductase [Smithella sp.]
MRFEHLFSPFTINGMTLKNRAVMPPMATGYGNADNTVSERLLAYLERRAQGGTGLIITEVCAVDPRGKGFPNEIGVWNDDFIGALSRIPAALHRHGAKAALQLHHAGRETFEAVLGKKPEAPSAIPSAVLGQPCEAMSLERIAEIVRAFAQAAGRARQAGFDSVELHGAHGYLLNQFLSPFSNNREDEYGGSEENRMRFILEVIAAARKAVGDDFPLWIRISADEMVRGGYDFSLMRRLAPRMVTAGVDAIHCSVGVYSTPGGLSIASMDTEPGFNLFRARALKEVVSVPIIGVGRINDPAMADQAIARGDADLISFGRQHLTDPDFIEKARRGSLEDIRRCTACNQGCIERLSFEMKSTTCSFNPECGREYKGPVLPAGTPKKVWVIGAGPAGLSAALVLAARGHQVEVFEKESQPGGQLLSASRPPHKAVFMDWVNWALRRLKQWSVPLHCSHPVSADDIKKAAPDAVIVASGAYPVTASIPGLKSELVADARDVLTGNIKLAGPAVVLGAGYVGMETADYLLANGIAVTVLEMQTLPPVNRFSAHGYWLNKRIKDSGGKIIFGARVLGIENNIVRYVQADKPSEEKASLIVTAMGAKSENTLEDVLNALAVPYRVVGDARSPRRILEAIHEGYKAGEEI